jgi:hypothetical protein
MDNDAIQKTGVAYHEAGHTVVALTMDGCVKQTGIVYGSEWSGETAAVLAKDDGVQAAYLAAGAIAQERGAPDSLGLFTDQGDITKLNALADKQVSDPNLIGPFALPEDKKKRQGFLDQANKTASQILERNWERVERLATALQASHQLSESEIDELLGPLSEDE